MIPPFTHRLSLLGLSGAVLVLSACGTQEIRPSPIIYVGNVAGPDKAGSSPPIHPSCRRARPARGLLARDRPFFSPPPPTNRT